MEINLNFNNKIKLGVVNVELLLKKNTRSDVILPYKHFLDSLITYVKI